MKGESRLDLNLQTQDMEEEAEADLTYETLQQQSLEPGVSVGRGESLPESVTSSRSSAQSGGEHPIHDTRVVMLPI